MTSIAENPAVTNPRKVLSQPQRDALAAIDHYRHQTGSRGKVFIGNKRFQRSTIDALEQLKLVNQRNGAYAATTAGKLVLDKLKGETQ